MNSANGFMGIEGVLGALGKSLSVGVGAFAMLGVAAMVIGLSVYVLLWIAKWLFIYIHKAHYELTESVTHAKQGGSVAVVKHVLDLREAKNGKRQKAPA